MLKEKLSKKKNIKTAIIGLGNVGLLYDLDNKDILTHSKSVFSNKNLELKFGIDLNKDKRKKFEKKYKLKTYASLKNNLNFEDVELLIISSSTHSHLDIIKKIPSNNRLKYIILEKPGGKNYSELLEIIHFCKKNKIHLSINYIRDFLDDFDSLKKIIKKTKNKKILCWYSRGMLNNCSHLINFMLSIFGWPRKITNLGRYKNFSNEIDFDFKISYKNTQIYFLCTPKKNISHNEIFVISENIKIISKNDFNTVYKKKIMLGSVNKIIAQTSKFLQADVLKKKLTIFKDKKKVIKNLKVNLMTLKLIDYVKNEKNY